MNPLGDRKGRNGNPPPTASAPEFYPDLRASVAGAALVRCIWLFYGPVAPEAEDWCAQVCTFTVRKAKLGTGAEGGECSGAHTP